MPSTIENLLNLKVWTEDEIKNRFAIAIRDLSTEEDTLKEYEDRLQVVQQSFDDLKEGLIDLSKMEELLKYQSYLIEKIEEQKGIITKKEAIVERIRLELVEATREKRIFQRLLEKEREKREKKIQKLEQSNIDESASLRYSMNEE